MSILINTIYAILTWVAAFVIGFAGQWALLGWALAFMAAVQSSALIVTAAKS